MLVTQELSDLKKLEETLFSNNLLVNLLGENNNGIDTDFESHRETCKFFEGLCFLRTIRSSCNLEMFPLTPPR